MGGEEVGLLNAILPRLGAGEGPAARVTSDRHARVGGYYLRQNHDLIQRHVESISLSLDHTARWALRVEIELPIDSEAHCEHRSGRTLFLFPLAYLSKSDGRLHFAVRNEAGEEVPVPTRQECDRISGIAAAQASEWLVSEIDEGPPRDSIDELAKAIRAIPSASPFAAAQIFDRLRRGLALDGRSRTRYIRGSAPKPPSNASSGFWAIGEAWEKAGLADVLRLLVEHSLAWVPVWGEPGERRAFNISQEISLERRPFLLWRFGEVDEQTRVGSSDEAGRSRSPQTMLKMGDSAYGRRSYRISLSVLGERIGQPLAWMPIEYDFPTVHTRRCGSYHFELTCPAGLSPRALKVASGDPIDEARQGAAGTAAPRLPAEEPPLGRTKLTPNIAHHHLPGNRQTGDLWFRVTVGVSAGAMPILWWLAGALTATLLWGFAATNPSLEGSEKEIAAGILLVVPALVAALAVGGENAPITRLIGGARILLLVTGLSAVVAAAVLIGAAPFGLQATWEVCAIATTIVTLPLATSWVLSNSLVWRQLKKLRTARDQYYVMYLGCGFAALPILALQLLNNAEVARACIAILLLGIVVAMTALANNRAAIEIGRTRHYVAASMLAVAAVCAALACIELKGAVDDNTGLQTWAERTALLGLVLAPLAGPLLRKTTSGFGPDSDEIHVSPQVGRDLIAKERVLELNELLDRRKKVELQTDPGEGVS